MVIVNDNAVVFLVRQCPLVALGRSRFLGRGCDEALFQ